MLSKVEDLFQDAGGQLEIELSNGLVKLSPESIRAISTFGWAPGRYSYEYEFFVNVLTRIAGEKADGTRELAIGAIKQALDLPDDPKSHDWSCLRGACVHALDALGVLKGQRPSDESQVEQAGAFRIEPISDADLRSPMQTDPYPQEPRIEAQALWQLACHGSFDEIMSRFERNFELWKREWTPRDLDLAYHCYGIALETQGRYAEAVLAYRWSCKLNPYHLNGAWQKLENARKKL